MITRRRLLALAFAPLPAAIAAGAPPVLAAAQSLPVDGAAVAGCISSWRLDLEPVHWDDALIAPAEAWARRLLRERAFYHDTTARGECIGAGQLDWSEVMAAWIASPPHLAVLRDPALRRVGVAGVTDGWRYRWVLRMEEA